MKSIRTTLSIAAVASLTLVGCKTSDSAAAAAKPYPLTTCIVSDEALDDDANIFVYNGQQLKTCCSGCEDDFRKEPAKFLTKLK